MFQKLFIVLQKFYENRSKFHKNYLIYKYDQVMTKRNENSLKKVKFVRKNEQIQTYFHIISIFKNLHQFS